MHDNIWCLCGGALSKGVGKKYGRALSKGVGKKYNRRLTTTVSGRWSYKACPVSQDWVSTVVYRK